MTWPPLHISILDDGPPVMRRAAFALVAVLLLVTAALPKKPKPTPCPGGRFTVERGTLPFAPTANAIVIEGGEATIDRCGMTKATLKLKTKKVTSVMAKWKHCDGGGPVTMTGTIEIISGF